MISLNGISLTSQDNSSMHQRLKNLNVTVSKGANTVTASDSVDISDEAKKNLATDIAASLFKPEQTTTTSGGEDIKSVDEIIEDLKEKIRMLMQEIAKLRAEGSEASQEQIKTLEAELAVLNAQLFELMSQEIEEQSGSSKT